MFVQLQEWLCHLQYYVNLSSHLFFSPPRIQTCGLEQHFSRLSGSQRRFFFVFGLLFHLFSVIPGLRFTSFWVKLSTSWPQFAHWRCHSCGQSGRDGKHWSAPVVVPAVWVGHCFAVPSSWVGNPLTSPKVRQSRIGQTNTSPCLLWYSFSKTTQVALAQVVEWVIYLSEGW